MNLIKRFWTALILLAAVFAVLQYGRSWLVFLFLQAVIIAALLPSSVVASLTAGMYRPTKV